MPIIKSAKKALRQSESNKIFNDATRAKVKNAVKGVKSAINLKKDNVAELLSIAYKELDIAAKKHVIHKNKAARLKSRLTKAAGKTDNIAPKPKKAAKKAAPKKTAKKK